jgi:hypothetical protein
MREGVSKFVPFESNFEVSIVFTIARQYLKDKNERQLIFEYKI